MRKHSLILAASTLALGQLAFAEETTLPSEKQLDTVSVTGLRPVETDQITTSFSLLTADQLDIRSSAFLVDELRAVPGVGVSRSGSKGGLTQVRIRGAEANHTLFLIDGIEVSDPSTGEINFGLFSGLSLDRIEILRGEQSGLYGSDAVGGVVNAITSDKQGLKGRVEYGTLETGLVEAGYGFDIEDGAFSISASAFTTDGVDTSDTGGETDGTENWSILANGSKALGSTWEVSGLALYSETDSQFDADIDFDGLLNDVDQSSETSQWLVGGKLQGESFGLNHLFRASYSNVDRTNYSSGNQTDSADGERLKLAYSPSKTFTPSFAEELRITGLIDFEKEDYAANDIQYGGLTNQNESFETFGIGGEAVLTNNGFTAHLSLRHDDNDGRFEDATTGRLGVAYDTGTIGRFRASIGSGVKNPNFTELFGFYPGSFIGNPDLKPEKSTSWEIGWDHAINDFEFSVTYFDADLEDEIYTAFTPSFLSTPMNRVGDSERSGVELGLGWTPTNELTITGQASFISSESDDGTEEIRVPEETASLSLDYRPANAEGYRFGAALDYVGDQDDFDFGSFPSRRVTMDSYVLLGASAEFPLNEAISLTLRGENLLDEDTSDVFGYASPGATAFIGLKLR